MNVQEQTRRGSSLAQRRAPDFTDQLIEPFVQLRSEIDHLFDGFPFRSGLTRSAMERPDRSVSAPPVEITETEKAYKVMAELPGMDPEKLEVTVDDGRLRIAGEKESFREENERDCQISERTYGSFERLIALPVGTDPDKIGASFKNGLLTVTIDKNAGKETARTIQIDKES